MNELIEIADINPEFRIQFNTYARESAILIQAALRSSCGVHVEENFIPQDGVYRWLRLYGPRPAYLFPNSPARSARSIEESLFDSSTKRKRGSRITSKEKAS
jgi:hypothetical protein